MIDIDNMQKMPPEIALEIAKREKTRRKRLGFTQQDIATRAAVSLGSLRRFEQTGQISLAALIRIAFALECEDEFDALFSRPPCVSVNSGGHR